MTPGEVDTALSMLVRRDLLRPEVSDVAGEDALRFTHVLVRDAAYNAISKTRRADLHLRLARWLAKRIADAPGADVFVGHHLGQAVALRDAMGPRDPATRDLAAEAVVVLQRAATTTELADPAASAALLDRAAQVSTDPREITRLRLRQCLLLRLARDLAGGAVAWRAARAAADQAADPRLHRLVALEGSGFGSQLPSLAAAALPTAEIDAAIRDFRMAGDDDGLVVALRSMAERMTELGRWGGFPALWDECAAAAERTGDELVRVMSYGGVGAYVFGPTPAAEGLERADELLSDPRLRQRNVRLRVALSRIPLLAMRDRAEDARRAADECRREVAEFRADVEVLAFMSGYGMSLIGDFEAAERDIRPAVEQLRRMGEVGWLSTLLPMLGNLCLIRGDVSQARECAEKARDISPPDDTESNALWRSLLALLFARDGDVDEALRLADDAVAWVRRGDQTDSIASRHVDRAAVRQAAGRLDEAAGDLQEAIRLYHDKGNIPSERRARDLLAAL